MGQITMYCTLSSQAENSPLFNLPSKSADSASRTYDTTYSQRHKGFSRGPSPSFITRPLGTTMAWLNRSTLGTNEGFSEWIGCRLVWMGNWFDFSACKEQKSRMRQSLSLTFIGEVLRQCVAICHVHALSYYRGVNKGLYFLLSRTQAGPGRTVKQEQEEMSRNHVQTFIYLPV